MPAKNLLTTKRQKPKDHWQGPDIAPKAQPTKAKKGKTSRQHKPERGMTTILATKPIKDKLPKA
jgi:hypothetical protein